MKYLITLLILTTCFFYVVAQEQLEVDGAINVQKAVGTGLGTIEYNGSMDDFRGRTTTGWKSLTSGTGGSSPWFTITGTNHIGYTAGNVAIGGTSVTGSMLSLEGSTQSMLRLQGTGSGGAYQQFYSNGSYWGLIGDENGDGSDLYFDIKSRSGASGIAFSTGTLNNAMRIENNGKIDLAKSINIGTSTGTPIAGDIRWDVATNDFQGYNGTSWLSLTQGMATTWGVQSVSENRKIVANDGGANDRFGGSVSIDDDYAIIGAWLDNNNGAIGGSAYVFKRNANNWNEVAKLTPSDGEVDDYFGTAISISGNYVVIGASNDDDNGSNAGAAYIFERDVGTDTWSEVLKIKPIDGETADLFGARVSISGETAIISAWGDDDTGSNQGAAYIFDRIGGTWVESTKLTVSDGNNGMRLGISVSISGNTAIIGADFENTNGTNAGTAYVFKKSGSSWNEEAKLVALDGEDFDQFGFSVSVFGDDAIIGAVSDDDNGNGAGAAYIFTRTGSTWNEIIKLTASDGSGLDEFGGRVFISENSAIVSAPRTDDAGNDSGSVYAFERREGSWKEVAKLMASDDDAEDRFGTSISMSGEIIIVGTSLEDSNGSNSGSAYIFRK